MSHIRLLQRAAHVLADIAGQVKGDDRQRLDALRTQIVQAIKEATPEYYGHWPFPTKLPPPMPAAPIPFNSANHEDALL